MINSWIIYLRLSSCHYVNKMIIGSSYGIAHGFQLYTHMAVIGPHQFFISIQFMCIWVSVSMNVIFGWFLIICYCHRWSVHCTIWTIGQRIGESSVRFGSVRLFVGLFTVYILGIRILLLNALSEKRNNSNTLTQQTHLFTHSHIYKHKHQWKTQSCFWSSSMKVLLWCHTLQYMALRNRWNVLEKPTIPIAFQHFIGQLVMSITIAQIVDDLLIRNEDRCKRSWDIFYDIWMLDF